MCEGTDERDRIRMVQAGKYLNGSVGKHFGMGGVWVYSNGDFVTQFFTGHGTFGIYTHRIGKAIDRCIYCGKRECAWERIELEWEFGIGLDENNVVNIML